MALNLSQKKQNVVGLDLNDQAMASASKQGLTLSSSFKELAASSSTIITMLPGDQAVNTALGEFPMYSPPKTMTVPL
jgi:3-hydroxyisobutyrate dehydrogenase-like beta-hydroxyacid dehydrogenase